MNSQQNAKAPGSVKKWLIAVRPFSFPASIVPVIFGAVLAATAGNASFNPFLFVLSLFAMMALHAGSEYTVKVVAESELRAAEKEGRKPAVLDVPMKVKSISILAGEKGYPITLRTPDRRRSADMLEGGTFAGVVRLQAMFSLMPEARYSSKNFCTREDSTKTANLDIIFCLLGKFI